MMEMDTYWVQRGGHDPIERIQRYGRRIKLLHQKDLPAKTLSPLNVSKIFQDAGMDKMDFSNAPTGFYSLINPEDFVEVGTGIMDLQGIVDAALQYSQAEYIILEQDFTVMDEFKSIAKSMEGFRKINHIQWKD